MEVKASVWDSHTQVVVVRSFPTKTAAMAYYDMFKNNKTDLKELNGKGYPLFAISSGNYPRFYVAKDAGGYAAYFGKEYRAGK